MTKLTTLRNIEKLEERYPFNEEELQILIRCYDHLQQDNNHEDFLVNLGHASPYAHFFLPGDEMKNRISWLEDFVLPAGFANNLRAAIAADAFVEYANQGEDRGLERFLEGIADTGRRGTKEALRVLYNMAGAEFMSPEEIVFLCFRLAAAVNAMVEPNLNKTAILKQIERNEHVEKLMAATFPIVAPGQDISLAMFTNWAESYFPLLSTPLSTFVHTLLFHDHPYPAARIPYASPQLDHASDIFENSKTPTLTALSFLTPYFGGKWHRLYSSEMDGRSFNRLEWSILGYQGPTMLIVKTDKGSILGAFSAATWQVKKEFYGDKECFLFQLEPDFKIYRHQEENENNFMYLNSKNHQSPVDKDDHLPHGLGFGGDKNHIRFFIPETFEHCSADFMDRTFETGDLVPLEEIEKFEFSCLEIWAVGGGEIIAEALRRRAEYRERTDTAIHEARTVHDKTFLANDMKSGLIPNRLFAHQADTRGRQAFQVDEKHGGYALDHDKAEGEMPHLDRSDHLT